MAVLGYSSNVALGANYTVNRSYIDVCVCVCVLGVCVCVCGRRECYYSHQTHQYLASVRKADNPFLVCVCVCGCVCVCVCVCG